MSIVHFHFGRRGGGPHIAVEIARALGELNIPSITLLSERNTFLAELDRTSVDVRTVRGQMLTPLVASRVRSLFAAEIELRRPSQILCCMSHPLDLFVLDLVARSKIPFKLVVHDGVSHLGDPLSWLWWFGILEQRVASGLITMSSHVTEQVHKRWPKKSIIQLWHPAFSPRPAWSPCAVSARPVGALRILFFGRIMEYKGLGLLLESCNRLQVKGFEFSLCVVGHGAITSRERLVMEILKPTFVNRYVTEAEAAGFFQDCDLVVLPYVEASQSGVVATAISFGKPVLATPVGGLKEQVEAMGAGLVCEECSVDALSGALAWLAEEPSRCGQLTPRSGHASKLGWREWTKSALAFDCNS